MGERKGQNHYYPPDFDYKKHKSLNSYHGTHALRERAKKIGQGILVIRFEMPFNIWCLGCNNHVGMGVRYNAEKKKVGMYYTTPLYEFRMKCHLCDNYYVIRTDPKNLDYELVEGCRRQEKRWDPTDINQLAPVERTKAGSAISQKMAADSMFKAEHEEKDKTKSQSADGQIDTLEWLQDRLRDDFAANQALRNQFRREKKELSEKRAVDDALRARGSLTIPLAPELPDDRKIAGVMMKMSKVKTWEERQEEARESINGRRIFNAAGPSTLSMDLSNTASGKEMLKQTVRHLKNKRMNESFEFAAGVEKRAKQSLGIVQKPKGNIADSTEEAVLDVPQETLADEHCTTSFRDGNKIKEDSTEKLANPLGLIANYGTGSSDSE